MVRIALVVALLAVQEPLAGSSPVPSPQPSPLKQIIEVKARALCATLGKNVQVALVGLMKNDQVIEVGRREFVKMSWDQVQGSRAVALDRLAIKNVVSAMVHNLYQIDQVLDDPSRFPLQPSTDDERAADRMKAALAAVADAQKAQLNILNGTVETQELSEMRHDFPDYNPVSNQPNQSAVPTASPTSIYDAGMQTQPKAAATAVPVTAASGEDGVAGTTPSAAFAKAMQSGQTSGAALEAQASGVIVPIARECQSVPKQDIHP